PSGGERRCASASLPLAQFQQIAVATGTTVNGALHGVIAGAKRAEMIARSEDLRSPAVTVFGVVADMASTRTAGNEISTALAYLRTDIADPVQRLTATAQSCAAAVTKRRSIGFELTDQIAVYTGRTGPVFRKLAAPVTPRVVNNITTANLPGPRETRWVGDIEVVDWISFALAIAPADVNLTAYSYAGRISMGLITTPESMPDPEGFLDRVRESLHEVRTALVERGMLAAQDADQSAAKPPTNPAAKPPKRVE
ncbi:WS/DGAT domain-containing protein, partial [Gordonia crocea]|uniref:WS/DGAT domain-containing protein n=1 Tax=Gordonia crocea TaxID=589162 RepID=UPI00137B18B9